MHFAGMIGNHFRLTFVSNVKCTSVFIQACAAKGRNKERLRHEKAGDRDLSWFCLAGCDRYYCLLFPGGKNID